MRLSAQGSTGSSGGAANVSQDPDLVLDPGALARLAELDPSGENRLIERVLQAFQTSSARHRVQAAAARANGDRAGLRLVAHTLKSASASIGALQLSQVCARIEASIRADAGADLDAELDAMDSALEKTLAAIARLLEERA